MKRQIAVEDPFQETTLVCDSCVQEHQYSTDPREELAVGPGPLSQFAFCSSCHQHLPPGTRVHWVPTSEVDRCSRLQGS